MDQPWPRSKSSWNTRSPSLKCLKDAFINSSTVALEDEYDSDGTLSKGDSETPHESMSSSEEEMCERHGDALYAPPLEPFSKGQKRRVANAVNQVLLGFETEKQSQREAEMAKHDRFQDHGCLLHSDRPPQHLGPLHRLDFPGANYSSPLGSEFGI